MSSQRFGWKTIQSAGLTELMFQEQEQSIGNQWKSGTDFLLLKLRVLDPNTMTCKLINFFIYIEDMDLCEKYDFTTAEGSDEDNEENVRPKNKNSKRNNVVLTSGRSIT